MPSSVETHPGFRTIVIDNLFVSATSFSPSTNHFLPSFEFSRIRGVFHALVKNVLDTINQKKNKRKNKNVKRKKKRKYRIRSKRKSWQSLYFEKCLKMKINKSSGRTHLFLFCILHSTSFVNMAVRELCCLCLGNTSH